MAINCDELKKLTNDEKLMEIIKLEKLNVWKTYKDAEDVSKNVWDEIDKIIQKTTNSDLITYLKWVKWINKNAFLIYQNAMASHWWMINNILKTRYKNMLSDISNIEDLRKIVNTQSEFVGKVNKLTKFIEENINNHIAKDWKKITKKNLKTYINDFVTSGLYNKTRQANLIDSFKTFIRKRYNEWIWKEIPEELDNAINNFIEDIKKTDVKSLPFTEWDKSILNYKWEITDKDFKEFIKNRDEYTKEMDLYNVDNKINAISNYNEFSKRMITYKETIDSIFWKTKKNSSNLLDTLNKQQNALNTVLENKKFANNIEALNELNINKINDKMWSLSFKITWFDVNLPINEQKKAIEDKIKDITGDNNFTVSLVDTQGWTTLFKVEWEKYTTYIPVDDLDQTNNIFNSIQKLNALEANEKWAFSVSAEEELRQVPYDPKDIKDDAYYNLMSMVKNTEWNPPKEVKEFISMLENPNQWFFWHKIIRAIEWFLMNSEFVKNRNPFFYRIIKKKQWIDHSSVSGEIASWLQDILNYTEKHTKNIEDNLWVILLWNYLNIRRESDDIQTINNLFDKYWDSPEKLFNMLKMGNFVKENIEEDSKLNIHNISDIINNFNKAKKVNKLWAYAQYINKLRAKTTKILSYRQALWNIIKWTKDNIKKYKELVSDTYKDSYWEYFKDTIYWEDMIESDLDNYYNGFNNVVSFNTDIWANYNFVDNIFRNLEQYKSKWLLKVEINKMNLSKWKAEKLLKDFKWISVYWKSFFPQLVRISRKILYTTELWWWSGKWWLLAWYNIITWWVKAKTAFSNDIRPYEDLMSFLKKAKKDNPDIYNTFLQDFADNPVFENILYNETSKYVDDNRNNYEWFAKKVLDTANSILAYWNKHWFDKLEQLSITSQELWGILSWPMWVADKVAEKMFWITPKIISESMEEHNISIDELSKLYDTISNVKKLNYDMEEAKAIWNKDEYKRLRTEYEELVDNWWIANYQDAERKFKNYLEVIRETATSKYQSFFKSSRSLWLSRNTLSHYWFINFFNSWGSKTAAEYIYWTVWKAYKEAMLSAKLYSDWNKFWSFMSAFTNSLLTSPQFNSFIRELWYWIKLAYLTSKADKDNNNLAPIDEVIQTTVAGQWFSSNSITRWILAAIKGFEISKEEWDPTSRALEMWMLNWVLSASHNALIELKYVIWPTINAMVEQLKKDPKNQWIINWVEDTINSYVDMYVSTYQTSFVSNLWYYLYDKYQGITYDRPDARQWYNVFEAISWIPISKYSDRMGKLEDYRYISDLIENPSQAISNLSSKFLGFYYGLSPQIKKDRFIDALNKDETFLKIRDNWDISMLADKVIYDKDPSWIYTKYIKDAYTALWQSDLLWGWTLENNWHWTYNHWIQLIFNDLREKWYNIDTVLKMIDDWLIRWKTKAKEQLAVLWLSKAAYSSLAAYNAQLYYKILKRNYLQSSWLKKVPDDELNKIKAEILSRYSSILAQWDKQFHIDLLDKYIKDTYNTNPLYQYYASSNGKRSRVWDYIYTRLFTEIADLSKIDWQPSLFDSMSATLFKDISDKDVPSKMDDFFKTIDSFWFIWHQWKNVMKAGILYSNRNRLKMLLNSKYWKDFQPAADKLASIIRSYAQDIKNAPNMLNWLVWWRHKVSIHTVANKSYKSPATKIFNWIQDLANQIVKLPQYRNIPVKSALRKIEIALQKMPDIKIPNNIPTINKLKEDIKTLQTKSLKTNALKTRKAKPKIARVRKPSMKAIKPHSHKSRK